jgi:post-segregation antitoxin (ccd killing protein)
VCILTRMSRLQVYLPEELHRQLKEHGLAPSELLQRAVREEVRRRELEAATDTYLAELLEEVGEPSTADVEYAKRFVGELMNAPDRHAG